MEKGAAVSDEIEKYRMVMEMAKDNGRKEVVCNLQEEKLKQNEEEIGCLKAKLDRANKEVGRLNAKLDKVNAEHVLLQKEREKDKTTIAKLEERCCQLEERVLKESETELQQEPRIVINNYIILSKPKTVTYVSSLDDNGRMFASHMLTNTISDNCTLNDYDTIKQITQLGGVAREQQLKDAIKEAATHPSTVIQNVEQITKIPSVSNYQPQIQSQYIDTSETTMDQEEQSLLEDE